MGYWSLWLSGLALAVVALAHFLLTERHMAVSGRFTALVNRLRFGRQEEGLSEAELIAAIRTATVEEFGEGEVAEPAQVEVAEPPPRRAPSPRTHTEHVLFLGALAVGGLLAHLVSGGGAAVLGLSSSGFAALTGQNQVVGALLLTLGGVCVGFGTSMAGGCTSGHGLCGASRLQPGSLVATLSFFLAAIVTSFALGVL
jgi:hypothetical protein